MFKTTMFNMFTKSETMPAKLKSQTEMNRMIAEQLDSLDKAMKLNKEIAEQLNLLAEKKTTETPNQPVRETRRPSLNRRASSIGVDAPLTEPESPTKKPVETKPQPSPTKSRFTCLPDANALLSFDIPRSRHENSEASHISSYSNQVPLLGYSRDRGGTDPSLVAKRSAKLRLHALFPEVEDLKEHVFITLRQNCYNVEDLYKKFGFWQALARSERFKAIIMFVILLNTIWIAIETEFNHQVILSEARWQFQVVDNLFCIFFLFELLVRLMSFEKKRTALTDGWFVFDSMLVSFMVWETWVMPLLYKANFLRAQGSSVFRVLRLTRLVRATRGSRLVGHFPEVLILAKGIFAGFRSVCAILMLLFLLIYIYAIVFVLTLRGSGIGDGCFDHVLGAMNFLMIQVICGPDPDIINALLSFQAGSWFAFLSFVVFANLTVLNLLIGILCDAVSSVAEDAKDEAFKEIVTAELHRLTDELDADSDGTISSEEFEEMIRDPVMVASLDSIGVDIIGVAEFARFIYSQVDCISLTNFLEMLSRYRGTKTASVKNVSSLMRYMSIELVNLEARLTTW